jgi:hypothetical protein
MSIEAGQRIDGANAYHGAEPLRPLLLEESQREGSRVHEEARHRGRDDIFPKKLAKLVEYIH